MERLSTGVGVGEGATVAIGEGAWVGVTTCVAKSVGVAIGETFVSRCLVMRNGALLGVSIPHPFISR